MTRTVLAALCLFGLLGAPAIAQPPPGAPLSHPPAPGAGSTHADDAHGEAVGHPAAEEEDLTAQPPVQAYYHRAFFGEPWRTPRQSLHALLRQGAGALTAVIVVGLWLHARRRRWNREAERS